MTKDLHPGLWSGALREALEGLVAELQALADRTYAPGGPGHEEFEKGLRTAYLIAAGRVQKLLSLSSPIEPGPTLTQERAKMIAANLFRHCTVGGDRTREEVLQEIASTVLTVDAAVRPIPQASSEVREALERAAKLVESFTQYDHTTIPAQVNPGLAHAGYSEYLTARIAREIRALAPSRQGAAKRVEG